jgi:hypothetical protein
MKRKIVSSRMVAMLVLAGLLVSGFSLIFPSESAAASPVTQAPQSPPDTVDVTDPSQLENAYQRELDMLKAQGDRLARMEERGVKLAEHIAKLKDEGKDVTVLVAALADYKSDISNARSQHEKAALILKTHAGFDANGKVTDIKQAAGTTKDAGKIMRGVHLDLRETSRDLFQAVRKFFRENRRK